MKKTKPPIAASPTLKIATISVFIILISTFIAYRSGYFDSESAQKALDQQNYLRDSLIQADSILYQKRLEDEKRMLMYGSKSGKVIDPNKDIHMSSSKSFQVLDKNDLRQDSIAKEHEKLLEKLDPEKFAVSSKSTRIFYPKDTLVYQVTVPKYRDSSKKNQ